MAKKKVPTVEELREYLRKEEEYLNDCVENNKTYVIEGPKFPGETIWRSKATLPLLEAAEAVGTSREEIWELCSNLKFLSHQLRNLHFSFICEFFHIESVFNHM